MTLNRVGVQAVGGTEETLADDAKGTAPVGDESMTLQQKRLKKQQELLRKKKAERRAHAKQRKQAQIEPTPTVAEEEALRSQEASAVVDTALAGSSRVEEERIDEKDAGSLPQLELPEREEIVSPPSENDRVPYLVAPHGEAVPQMEAPPQDLSGPEAGFKSEESHEDEEPEARPAQALDSPKDCPQQPSSSSLPSEAVTLSVGETDEAFIHGTLCAKSARQSRSPGETSSTATTISKTLLQHTKRTLSKAKSLIRHSSKVLVEVESMLPDSQRIPTRPEIVPPLNLKPRSPLPSSASCSDAESSQSSGSSSSESSPTRTRSSLSNSIYSSRSRSSSSSSSSSRTERSRHHRIRTHKNPREGPSADMLLPPMLNDRARLYGELHDSMATRIQARVRGMRGRLHARQLETERDREIRAEALHEIEEEASVRIQAHIKGFLERRRLGLDDRLGSKSPRQNHRSHKHSVHPRTKGNRVMPQCLADSVMGQGDPNDKVKVAEWPDEFDLEPLDKWDELNSKATPEGELVTTHMFLNRSKLRVFCGTWNLHAKKPTDDLRLWIRMNRYHIVAVGTEECVHSIAKSVVFTSKKQWEDQLKDTLGSEYVLMAAHSLTAIHNVVFVHESVLPLVHNIQSDAVATGLGNQLGNKGGVGIAFSVGSTSLAFVNCHFDAHQHNVAKRNANFHRINHELKLVATVSAVSPRSGSSALQGLGKSTVSRFTSASTGSSSALNAAAIANSSPLRAGSSPRVQWRKLAVSESFDRVFWYGDLNYRINGTRRMIDLLLLHNHHAVLRFNDQLRIEMHKGNVFPHFQEGPLHFRPTYKFDKHTNVYDSGPKQRIPSWTDRILYLSNDKPSDIELLSYRSHMTFQTSDHRPVGAAFQVTFRRGGEPTTGRTGEGDASPVLRGGGEEVNGREEEAQAFARVLAKGYKPSQSRSEVCVVQ